jgi:hypothetical protein
VVTTKKAQSKRAHKVGVSKARTTTRVAGAGTGAKKSVPSRKSAGPRPVAFDAPVLGIVEPAAFLKGKRGKAPSKTEVSEAAKVLRAYKELVRLAELRLIHQARRSKTSQNVIAALLGTSQPTVSRIAKQIDQTPSVLEPSPSEIINQRAVRQIDDETMMNMLLAYAYTPGRHDPTGGDGFVRGDWRQIENALIAGLITDEEYERIAHEAPTAKPARVSR